VTTEEGTRGARTEAREVRDEVRGIAEDLRDLARSEVQLARASLHEELRLLVGVVACAAIVGVTAFIAVIFLSLGAMYGLDHVVPLWVAALIVAAGLLVIAAIAGLMARGMVRRLMVAPKRSANSIKEDVSWARAQLRSNTTSNASVSG
jgi:uncharacterized membrane protein YqjE